MNKDQKFNTSISHSIVSNESNTVSGGPLAGVSGRVYCI